MERRMIFSQPPLRRPITLIYNQPQTKFPFMALFYTSHTYDFYQARTLTEDPVHPPMVA